MWHIYLVRTIFVFDVLWDISHQPINLRQIFSQEHALYAYKQVITKWLQSGIGLLSDTSCLYNCCVHVAGTYWWLCPSLRRLTLLDCSHFHHTCAVSPSSSKASFSSNKAAKAMHTNKFCDFSLNNSCEAFREILCHRMSPDSAAEQGWSYNLVSPE